MLPLHGGQCPIRQFPRVQLLQIEIDMWESQAALIPREALFKPGEYVDLGFEYFNYTIGHVTSGIQQTRAICGSFKALSAIGNVIVFTFTAARGKDPPGSDPNMPAHLIVPR